MNEGLIQKIVEEVVRRLRALEGIVPARPMDPPVKLVTEELILGVIERGGKILPVLPRAIVTPLAQDLLRRGQVRLEVVTETQAATESPSPRSMSLALGSDRRGKELKDALKQMLQDVGRDVIDVSVNADASYVLTARAVAKRVVADALFSGIVIDTGGAPSAIVANKVKGIRAVACYDVTSAKFARAHLDANVLCLGVGSVGDTVAKEIVATWLRTPFEGGPYADRVREIDDIEDASD